MEANNTATLVCVNCGVNLIGKWKAYAVEQSIQIISLISEKIAPNVLTEYDYVCKPCSQLSVKILDNSELKSDEYQVDIQEEEMQHAMVTCIVCDISLIDRQSRGILKDNPTQIDTLMCSVIKRALAPNMKITADHKLCTKCWMTAKRSAFDLQKENLEHQTMSDDEDSSSSNSSTEEDFPENGYDEPLISPIKSEPEDEDSITEIKVVDTSDNETEVETQSTKSEPYIDDPGDLDFIPNSIKKRTKANLDEENSEKCQEDYQIIKLPNYKRAPATTSRCIFQNCKNPDRCLIPVDIKIRVLKDHKYFITDHARACKQHLASNCWEHLPNQKSNITSFRVVDVENAISLMQIKNKKLDFHNILLFNDNLFKFLLGITKDTFSDILNKIPKLQSLKMGLVAFLIYHNNQSKHIVKLSRLLNISRKSLANAMKNVKTILANHPATKEWGIES